MTNRGVETKEPEGCTELWAMAIVDFGEMLGMFGGKILGGIWDMFEEVFGMFWEGEV